MEDTTRSSALDEKTPASTTRHCAVFLISIISRAFNQRIDSGLDWICCGYFSLDSQEEFLYSPSPRKQCFIKRITPQPPSRKPWPERTSPPGISRWSPSGWRFPFPPLTWETMMEAKFSAPYAVAPSIIRGEPELDWYSKERYRDSDIRRLAQKIKFVEDPRMAGSWILKAN